MFDASQHRPALAGLLPLCAHMLACHLQSLANYSHLPLTVLTNRRPTYRPTDHLPLTATAFHFPLITTYHLPLTTYGPLETTRRPTYRNDNNDKKQP